MKLLILPFMCWATMASFAQQAPRRTALQTGAAEVAEAGLASADVYRQAIKAGIRDAIVDLGFCYELGIGGEAVDLALALQCFSSGAQRSSPAAMFQLALCYASGMKVKANPPAALDWLTKSAVLGYAPAVAALERPRGQTWTAEFDFMRRMTTPSPIFGEEATRLFQAISGEYRLKEGILPETPSAETVQRALRSTDPGVAAIGAFHKTYLDQIAKSPRMMADMKRAEGAAQRNLSGGMMPFLFGGGDPLEGANDLLEGVLGEPGGGGLQQTMNSMWKWQFDLQKAQADMRQATRDFANRTSAQVPAVPDAITARMTIRTVTLAGLAVTNRTDRVLHHCLILSRQQPRSAQMKAEAEAHQTLADALNKAMGVERDFRDAHAEGGNLQTKILTLEHGCLTYVPVLPAGATVEVPLCDPQLLADGPYVDAALWCDELKSESPRSMNFKEAQAAYEHALAAWRQEQVTKQRAGGQPGSGGLPAKKPGLGQWKNPLDEPARRVGR